MIIYVARYTGTSIVDIEKMPVTNLKRYAEALGKLIEKENGPAHGSD